MIKILFICHGNICRSPMAEFVMKSLVREAGLEMRFSLPPPRRPTRRPAIPSIRRCSVFWRSAAFCAGKTARRVTRGEYANWDYIVGMDAENRCDLLRLFGGDPENKVSLLLDFTDRPRSVADPWYTRDFTAAERDIDEGCQALLAQILET